MKLTANAIFITVLSASSVAQANLVNNGSFELPKISTSNIIISSGSSTLAGWEISGTSGIDLVGSVWQPVDGNQSVSLNWTSPSTISQTISTNSGSLYELEFSLAAEHPAANSTMRTLDIFWGNSLVSSLSFDPAGFTNVDMGWITYKFQLLGTGVDELKFVSTTPANYGPALDNISVSAVPEPHPAALYLLGCTAIFLLSQRSFIFARFGGPLRGRRQS